MSEEVMATLRASPVRRWFGVAVMALLGGLLIYVALAQPPALMWQAFLLVLGAAALWLADATRRATEEAVELTAEGLRDTSGEVIVRVDQIAAVSRGTFALKPSNGFMLILKEPRPRRWRPGLWWAFGRRVGLGGVTPGAQSKVMAQMLEAMIAGEQAL